MKHTIKSEIRVDWLFQLAITWYRATKHRLS